MPRERKGAKKNNHDGDDIGPVKASKKRRTSTVANNAANAANNASSAGNTNQHGGPPAGSCELFPPQPSNTYGDTLFAANPFDDYIPSNNQPNSGPNANNSQMSKSPQIPPPSQHGNQQQPGQVSQQPQQQPHQQQKPIPIMSGKVYPENQPMVFNPANPNAPPIYPCGICHKEVHENENAVLCESGCNFWFHRVCTGLSEIAFHLLTAEVYAEWVCDKCLASKQIPLVKFKT